MTVLNSRTFAARLAHCNVGPWKRDASDALSKCETLLKEDLTSLQKKRVNERQAQLAGVMRTQWVPNRLPPKKREHFTIKCSDLNYEAKPLRWLLKNALREIHQKRNKNSKPVKDMKKRYKLSGKSQYKCPRCKIHVQFLTAAHIGKPISRILDEILDAYPRCNISSLDEKLRHYHQDLSVAVCCRKCNDELEE